MRFDWLESFLAFAETRSFTRAAERLHVSQPALHVQVRRLGESLGVALYHRDGRELVLTEDGRRVEAFARETLARNQAFAAKLRAGIDRTPPVLVAGAGTHRFMLAEALRDWVAHERPLALRTGDKEAILDDLRSGRAHLGIAPLSTDERGIEAFRFRRVGQMAVVTRDHPLAKKSRTGIASLGQHSLVLPPPDRPHALEVRRALRRELGQDPQVAVEAGGWDLMMLFASLGMGVAIVNDYCVAPPGTVAVPVTGLPALEYFLLRRAGGIVPPLADDLFAHLSSRR